VREDAWIRQRIQHWYYGYADQPTSIKVGNYDDKGDIVVNGGNIAIRGGAKTTGGKKFALTYFLPSSLELLDLLLTDQELIEGIYYALADVLPTGVNKMNVSFKNLSLLDEIVLSICILAAGYRAVFLVKFL
jgi:hypothetical protein